VAGDQEWQRIIKHFRDAFFRRYPSPPKAHHEDFFDSLETTLREFLGDRAIEFVDLAEGKRDDADDFGAALLFAGGQFYKVRVRSEELQVVVIGELPGGRYHEETQLADGQIIQTTIKYEHPRLEERREPPLVFKFTPKEAKRFTAVRRGLRVWGTRTIDIAEVAAADDGTHAARWIVEGPVPLSEEDTADDGTYAARWIVEGPVPLSEEDTAPSSETRPNPDAPPASPQ
jgi:hypothetical protein